MKPTAQNKTIPTHVDVSDFVAQIDSAKQADTNTLIAMMSDISGEPAVMWGSSIIGFGMYHYTYASGRQGDWLKIGFSPRASAFSLYVGCDASLFTAELQQLGTYTRGKGCIYIKNLDVVDTDVLRALLQKAYRIAGQASGS